MKTLATALLAVFAFEAAHAAKLTTKGLLFYDSNEASGYANVQGDAFEDMTPHNGTYGIVMFGQPLPTGPESYTAQPRGPLIFSFVMPQSGRPATVSRVDFWVSNPSQFSNVPLPVPIRFLNAEGQVVATQQIAELEFPVSFDGGAPITSVEVGETPFPQLLMVSDIRFAQPRLVHDREMVLTHPAQLRSDTRLVNFDTLPSGGAPTSGLAISNQWQETGAVFSDDGGGSGEIYREDQWLAVRSGNYALKSWPTLTIHFVDAKTGGPASVKEVGFWIVNAGNEIAKAPTTVEFLSASGAVLQRLTSSGKFFFAGASSRSGITKIVMNDPDRFLLDDLSFSKPEPLRVDTHRLPGGQIMASWPAVFSNFTVQVARHLNRTNPRRTTWSGLTVEPSLVNNVYCVTNAITQGRFFRLVPK